MKAKEALLKALDNCWPNCAKNHQPSMLPRLKAHPTSEDRTREALRSFKLPPLPPPELSDSLKTSIFIQITARNNVLGGCNSVITCGADAVTNTLLRKIIGNLEDQMRNALLSGRSGVCFTEPVNPPSEFIKEVVIVDEDYLSALKDYP